MATGSVTPPFSSRATPTLEISSTIPVAFQLISILFIIVQSLIISIYVLIRLLFCSLSNILAVSYKATSIQSRVVSMLHLMGLLTSHLSNPLNVVLSEQLKLNQQNTKYLSGSSPVIQKPSMMCVKPFYSSALTMVKHDLN